MKYDKDRLFIMNGLLNGFSIIDVNDEETIVVTECENHKSCFSTNEKRLVTERVILTEVNKNNYVVSAIKPKIVIALGAVPKTDSNDIRLIHDASRPLNRSLNYYASVEKTHYTLIDKVCSILKPNGYLAKVDLSQAYRHVSLSPNNYFATGLKWKFTGFSEFNYIYDAKLCCGAAKAPSIFQRITESSTRMLKRRGFKGVCVYLDDFIIVADTYEECKYAFDCLVDLLGSQWFTINWHKVVEPAQEIVFLGVLIDSVYCTLSIPELKLTELTTEIKLSLHKKKLQNVSYNRLLGRKAFTWHETFH